MDAEWNLEVAERLARLEATSHQAERAREELKEAMNDITGDFKEIKDTLSGMREELARYRGLWGGIMLVCGAIWAFLEMFGGAVAARLKGEG
jgi:Flp pilus assembly protein TadB